MPPRHNESPSSVTGWKVAMGLLMLMQTVALGVMWRTFDAISELRKESTIATYQLNHEVKPILAEHKSKIEELQRAIR